VTQTAPTHPNPAPQAAIPKTCAIGDDKLCAAIDASVVIGWIGQLARFEREVADAERIDQLRALEQLKSAAEPGPRHTLRITTPTGHSYRSTAPAPPGHPRSERRRPAGKRARRTGTQRALDG
jgi:hypothetical protein